MLIAFTYLSLDIVSVKNGRWQAALSSAKARRERNKECEVVKRIDAYKFSRQRIFGFIFIFVGKSKSERQTSAH